MFNVNPNSFSKHLEKPDLLCVEFYKHKVALAHGAEKCFPLRLFLDFARLDNRQQVLNVTVNSLFDNTRIPVGSFHRNLFCRCGCRGAHTFQPIMDLIAWIFKVFY